ncbi:outer membrane protein [Cucumibacter marinus]|uniref:outer membrane protein n=1 Tax=Cucumibacter marinus TaxID=1121252 RepID=UPI0004069871|nr:hypothetical protein [Cucumibacter marinus]
MRKILAIVALILAAGLASAAHAADMPEPPVYTPPPPDYGYEGNFYLRGSKAVNVMWARSIDDCCSYDVTEHGFGYSFGAGFGYETGTGLRFDATVDYLTNSGLTSSDGHVFTLRSALVLANVYYDFGLGGGGGGYDGYGYSEHSAAAGGWNGYIGAGIGKAYQTLDVEHGVTTFPTGTQWSWAAAGMAGVAYDSGNWVTDLGYRMVYMRGAASGVPADPNDQVFINHAFAHELRASLRYRIY